MWLRPSLINGAWVILLLLHPQAAVWEVSCAFTHGARSRHGLFQSSDTAPGSLDPFHSLYLLPDCNLWHRLWVYSFSLAIKQQDQDQHVLLKHTPNTISVVFLFLPPSSRIYWSFFKFHSLHASHDQSAADDLTATILTCYKYGKGKWLSWNSALIPATKRMLVERCARRQPAVMTCGQLKQKHRVPGCCWL